MYLLPNLIIPGAPKSGTTSLCEYLKQHDEIFVPTIKEPRFFINEIVKNVSEKDPLYENLIRLSAFTEENYKERFKKGETAKFRCDASVHYMYYHELVIPKLKTTVADPHIIIMLRNPVTRAFSNYVFLANKQNNTFEDGLKLENTRKADNWFAFWYFTEQGFYYEAVKKYMQSFSHVKIILFDEFNKDTSAVVKDVFAFLDVKEVPIDTGRIHNKSGVPKNKFVKWLLFNDNVLKSTSKRVFSTFFGDADRYRLASKIRNNFRKNPELRLLPETHNFLVDLYRDDILKLEELLKTDLSQWLKKK
ncbi:sulfotransferase [Ilyomonas limi]|uniref:Sulfotransferase n=1 Tax=Ilyomonas limi TaxID=2575867 RepID=A0A4U3KYF4_9BACT|nr:sulfotransferase [Ilyomonas limi]TKK67402.1 sulfotransferase [Ilyomonas limi]